MNLMIKEIREFAAQGATFVVSHSGGKDSQALLLHIAQLVPVEQIAVIHVDMKGFEWAGTEAHMRQTAMQCGIPADRIFVRSAAKSIEDKVRDRGMFPGMQQRWCTSDLKRDVINKFIRNLTPKTSGQGLVISCSGERRQESEDRSKLKALEVNKRAGAEFRKVWTLRPILDLREDQVRDNIRRANQQLHWAYGAGMKRLSCCFCIFGSDSDFAIAAKHNPQLLTRLAKLEREVGHTIKMPEKGGRLFLDERFPQFLVAA